MNGIFQSIALCFSGGGYRASCFSLGSLSFLEKAGILEKVKAISTVSGGTITGVKYTQSQINRQNFNSFFKEYYLWLESNSLVANAIPHLNNSTTWKMEENEHKRPNPINAFAIEYNKFTNNKTLGDIDQVIKANKTHLKRVIFNATDFTNGMAFRFQNLDVPQRKIGNKKISDNHSDLKNHLDKMKLGDILAASSAFPGGFEPIGFPNDFFKTDDFNMNEIGLMDGGIIDNQGISSLLTSDKKEYDLYIINDVASPYIDSPFNFSVGNNLITLVRYISSFLVFLLVIVFTVISYKQNWIVSYSIGLFTIPILLIFQVLFFYASFKLKRVTGITYNLIFPSKKVGFYLLDRIKSVIKMMSEIFLKSARRSNFEKIYDELPKQVTTSTVYELRCENKKGIPENENKWKSIQKYTGDIPKKMKDVSRLSTSFDTTLWFSKQDKKDKMLDAVIACGEYTTCYNLISFFVKNHSEKIEEDGDVKDFFKSLLILWDELKKNPYHIVDGRKEMFNSIK